MQRVWNNDPETWEQRFLIHVLGTSFTMKGEICHPPADQFAGWCQVQDRMEGCREWEEVQQQRKGKRDERKTRDSKLK